MNVKPFLLFGSLTFCIHSFANQETEGFSIEMLNKLGIDPSLIKELDEGRIEGGEKTVMVYLNGSMIDFFELNFVDNNDFYIDKKFFEKLNLDEELLILDKDLFKNVFSDARVIYDYENASINLTIPYYYFKENKEPKQEGRGGFVNYKINYDQSLENDSGDSISDTLSIDSNYGLNFDGFLFRGGASYNNFNDEINFKYNFIQKNLIDRKTIFRTGDIFTFNPYHSNIEILGVQYTSDNAFSTSSTIRIEGNVSSPSRVEVYANNDLLIYTTTVPSGFYELTDVVLPFTLTTLRVLEIGEDGLVNERDVSVQQTEFNIAEDSEFAFSVGYANRNVIEQNEEDLGEVTDTLYDDWVVSGYTDVYKDETSKITTSALIGEDYYFLGAGYIKNLEEPFYTFRSFNIETGANYSDEFNEGFFASGSLNFNYSDNYNLNLFSRYESLYFKQLENDPTNFKSQYSLSLSTPIILFDTMSLSFNKNYYYEDLDSTHSVNLNFQKTFDNDSYVGLESFYDSDDQWNVNLFVSIPISFTDKINYVDFGYLKDSFDDQFEVSASGSTNGYNYNGTARHFKNENFSSGSLNVNKNYEDIYLNAGVFATDDGIENVYGEMRGGFGFNSKGYYDFLPEYVSDTFGFVTINELDNVKIRTPNADIITENGIALIPSITPYKKNVIEVVTSSLPENTTLDNGYQEMYLSYSSIGELNISTKPFYQSLIRLVDKDGIPLTSDYIVVDTNDYFITIVGFDGLVFFESEEIYKTYKAKKIEEECTFILSDAEFLEEDSNVKTVECF